MVNLNFDANTVDPQQSFEPLPPDWYQAKIIESELKETNAGTGTRLALTLEVIGGQYNGRKVFDNLNLQNPNPVAVEIAQKQLSAYCHATGVMQVQDSQQLHGIPFMAKIGVRPAQGQYDASNDVKGIKALEGGGQAAPAQPGMQAPQQPQAPQQQPMQQPPAQPAQQQAPAGWQQPPQQQAPQQPPAQQAPQQQPMQQQAPAQQPDPNAGQAAGPAGNTQAPTPPWAGGGQQG